jgi:hypothetical protein
MCAKHSKEPQVSAGGFVTFKKPTEKKKKAEEKTDDGFTC